MLLEAVFDAQKIKIVELQIILLIINLSLTKGFVLALAKIFPYKHMKHRSKTWIYSALLLPGLMLFAGQTHAATPNSFNFSDFQVPVGGTVTVPLSINIPDGEDIGNFYITLTYDKSVVKINQPQDVAVNSAFLNQYVFPDAADPNTSVIEAFSAAPGVTGDVLLANITFTAVSSQAASTPIVVTAGSFTDSSNVDLSPAPDPVTATATVVASDPVDAFSFTPQTNVALNTPIDSNSITVSGSTNPSEPISIVGGTYSVDGGAFTSDPGSVVNGDTIIVEQTSSMNFSTTTTATLTIDSMNANFDVTTLAADITPDPFSFDPQTGVALSTPITSNTVTISGTDAPSPISITGGTYSIDGGAFTSDPGTINSGQTVAVQQTSSANPLITTTATLTIDSINANFDVTTLAADITPDPFSFDPQTGVALSTPITSNSITITGIDAPSPISIAGNSGQYSIDGGTFTTTAGTISNNDTVQVRQTSSSSSLVTTTTTLTIDGVQTDFDVTTLAAAPDTTPDTFTLKAITNAPLSVVRTALMTVSGINASTPISISGNSGEYSINNGNFTSSPGTVNNGDVVIVEQTSSPNYSTETTTTLTIGGVSADFDVTTIPQPTINVAPVLESIGTLNAVINTPFNFTAQASDANGDKLTFSLGSNAPSDATIDPNSGVLSWTPTALDTFTFDVIVSDGTLTDTQSATIIVSSTPVPVVSTSQSSSHNNQRCNSYVCRQYRKYKKFRSPANHAIYFQLRALQTSDPTKFQALQDTFTTYRKMAKSEVKQLNPTTLADFKLFKKYNGYKHYKTFKAKI